MPSSIAPHTLAGAVAAGGALLVTGLADGPRTALLVALLAGAVTLTRVRYAPVVALALLILMAGVAISGNGPGQDSRPDPAPRVADA